MALNYRNVSEMFLCILKVLSLLTILAHISLVMTSQNMQSYKNNV